jgi:hypothetical protein
MRFVLVLLAPFAIAATAPAQTAPDLDLDFEEPQGDGLGKNCRDRIVLVREERGLPKLERDTASPDEPLLIAAVDKRIDGCAVMVMHGNTSDVRPLPEFQEGSGQLMPAR